ncbi:YciI family protein [Saccharopolyspora erythraea]|uniref:DGPFAETKE family protein n=2 Tax=Saccharopolyspora erythraea TaxID=1836 RepID=A4FLM9_SACEN|nr:YciI family protein [Saccharopolyspora erythraea]QRK88631.1 hypothetical protein JQX30_28910 [Saccharopolyspora erythraea]CAM04954.1 DGPFAETKE family protein [Saccharopolyspora erythraea NRRL 2338]
MRDAGAVNDEMRAAGAWMFAGGLHAPSTATVLKAQGSGMLTADGPFAEGEELLGGLAVIRAADLDEALRWGRELARATTLPIEVRPFHDQPES